MAYIINAYSTTGSDIFLNDLGIFIPFGSGNQIDLSERFRYIQISESSDLYGYVNSGDIVINDGTSDLSIFDALLWIKNTDEAHIHSLYELVDTNFSDYPPGSDYAITYKPGLNNKWVAEEANVVFGVGVYNHIDDGPYSTTSPTYVQATSYITPILTAGSYRVAWYWEWSQSNGSKEFATRLQVDDTTTLAETSIIAASNSVWQSQYGFAFQSFMASSYTIDLDYSAPTGGTSYIRRIRLEIWKVTN